MMNDASAVSTGFSLSNVLPGFLHCSRAGAGGSLNRIQRRWLTGMLLLLGPVALPAAESPVQTQKSSFTLFESGQVRPLALSPNRQLLFALNTPDNRVEIFRLGGKRLKHLGAVSVGLEPVAIAARSDREVWVVNHLSDSVSIVRFDPERGAGRVVKTLLVGDEPRDIVFAGPGRSRAFITAAHRGQNAPFDPQLTTPGIGRADVWVFDAQHPGNTPGGTPMTIINLFGDTPRALAVSPGGDSVYAAVFHSGNRTTSLFQEIVSANGGLPEPLTNFEGMEQPATSLIVQYDGEKWVDAGGRDWSAHVKFSLPDKDVFTLDANANPPVEKAGDPAIFNQVGTVIFNMGVNPRSGRVYVANTEAQNLTRFEGPGEFGGSTVRGHIAESRITVLDPADGSVMPRHLNKHIDYSVCCAPLPNEENRKSLAFPMDMAITEDGQTLYVVAFGSSKIGVFDTDALETDSYAPDTRQQITLGGGGPSGLVLDEDGRRLYVLTRFDNAVAVIDTDSRREIARYPLFNPEPESIVKGRPFLYDAASTSSHGDSACASCHVFGDFDSLAWDLGDPDASEINNPGPFALHPLTLGFPTSPDFRPLKGPMTTQSLRGLDNHGPMHWRGDRTGGNDAPSAQPNSGTFDESEAFNRFNVAFPGLNGRHAQLPPEQMQQFTDFALQIMYPPNPVRRLDNSLTPEQAAGRDFYFGARSDTVFNCNGCHLLDPDGNAEFGLTRPGFFGTDGRYSFEFESQIFKIPHLRNLYQKVGMFGQEVFPFITSPPAFFLPPPLNSNAFMGDQIRGFGFLHDGSTDTIFRFMGSTVFAHRPDQHPLPNPGGFPLDGRGIVQRRQVEQFLLAYPSNLAPIVGQQVTLTRENRAVVKERLELLMNRAEAGECDLIAKGLFGNREKGYLYQGNGFFQGDKRSGPAIPVAKLHRVVSRNRGEITFTCVPPGSGYRIGLDRDEDGVYDGDEIAIGKKIREFAKIALFTQAHNSLEMGN